MDNPFKREKNIQNIEYFESTEWICLLFYVILSFKKVFISDIKIVQILIRLLGRHVLM